MLTLLYFVIVLTFAYFTWQALQTSRTNVVCPVVDHRPCRIGL